MCALASGQACVESDREDRTKWMGKYRSRGKRTKTKTPKHTRTVLAGVEREDKRKEYDAAIAAAKSSTGATVGIQGSTGVGAAEATGANGSTGSSDNATSDATKGQ